MEKNQELILKDIVFKVDRNNAKNFHNFENAIYQEFSKKINKNKLVDLNGFYKELDILIKIFEKAKVFPFYGVENTYVMFGRLMFFRKFLENIKGYENFHKEIKNLKKKEGNILFLFLYIDYLKKVNEINLISFYLDICCDSDTDTEEKEEENYRKDFLNPHDQLDSTKIKIDRIRHENSRLNAYCELTLHIKNLISNIDQIGTSLKKSIFNDQEVVDKYLNLNELFKDLFENYLKLWKNLF